MTTVQDILDFMQTVAPVELKMDWDNVGLSCGSRSGAVTSILLALDPFEHVCQEAVDVGADLLITHHPLIFRPFPMVTDDAAITRGLMNLCRHGISAIGAHTNLDCAAGGVNDVLAELLGLRNIETIGSEGVLRTGTIDSCSLPQFLNRVKTVLGTPVLRYTDGGKAVHKVCVGGGGCSGMLFDAVQAGCDTFVTADAKYNEWWDAYEQGLSLIDAGHFYTENPVMSVLAQKLRSAFPEIRVKISEKHQDCMKFY